jgi:hypothetical protein
MSTHTGEFPRLHTSEISVRVFLLHALSLIVAAGVALSALTMSSEVRDDSRSPVVSVGHRPSHERRYFAEVVAMPETPAVGVQTWDVQLTRRNHRRVTSATVAARVWMPETGETSATGIVGHYIGDGRYRFTDLPLTKAGWWNIDLAVDGIAGRDSVAFNVIVPSSPGR